jgi:hypothetical protein
MRVLQAPTYVLQVYCGNCLKDQFENFTMGDSRIKGVLNDKP